MSIENVDRFYALLDRDAALRERALRLQTIYEEQEDVLDAFLALAEEYGLPFTESEFMNVMYRRATTEEQ